MENTEARINNFRPDEMASLLYGLSHLAASKHIHQQEEHRLAMQVCMRMGAFAHGVGVGAGACAQVWMQSCVWFVLVCWG